MADIGTTAQTWTAGPGTDAGADPGIEFSEIYILAMRERYYFSLLPKYIIPVIRRVFALCEEAF